MTTDGPLAPPRYFRFLPMIGGHANDSDEIVCRVPWATEDELLGIFRTCGAELELLPPDAHLPVPGEPITPDMVSPQHGAPRFRSQPWTTILGIPVNLSVRVYDDGGGFVVLALFGADGDSWAVTAADWHNAAIVEPELLARGLALLPGDHLGRSIDGGPEAWPRR